MPPTDRRYWKTMTYACNACGYEMPFYLEDGCEGPKQFLQDAVISRSHPTRAGEVVQVWYTRTNREVIPVPFVAGLCPNCRTGNLLHVRWDEDIELPVPVTQGDVPEQAGCFEYPDRETRRQLRDQACGRPVYRREGTAEAHGAQRV